MWMCRFLQLPKDILRCVSSLYAFLSSVCLLVSLCASLMFPCVSLALRGRTDICTYICVTDKHILFVTFDINSNVYKNISVWHSDLVSRPKAIDIFRKFLKAKSSEESLDFILIVRVRCCVCCTLLSGKETSRYPARTSCQCLFYLAINRNQSSLLSTILTASCMLIVLIYSLRNLNPRRCWTLVWSRGSTKRTSNKVHTEKCTLTNMHTCVHSGCVDTETVWCQHTHAHAHIHTLLIT